MNSDKGTSIDDGRGVAWKPIANLIFQAFLILVLGIALFFTLDWPRETALFPQAVGTPVLALLLVSLGLQLFRMRRYGLQPEEAAIDETDVADLDFLRRAAVEFAWLFVLGLAIWIVGFYPATFAFLFLYLRFQAKLSATASLLWSASAAVFVFVVFNVAFRMDIYGGLLMEMFH